MIVNLQRKVRIDTKTYNEFVERLRTAITEVESREFAVAFISDRRMKELNKFFRSVDSTTDVLSFPFEEGEKMRMGESEIAYSPSHPLTFSPSPFLGDIVISVEQAQKQAEENGLTLENEIKQLILHGLLHLCGYDHETDEGEMNARELQLREELEI